jgi:hypothetical protein
MTYKLMLLGGWLAGLHMCANHDTAGLRRRSKSSGNRKIVVHPIVLFLVHNLVRGLEVLLKQLDWLR